MTTASPLRYPGGKAALAGIIRQVIGMNGFTDCAIAEPYAGGAGASLTLLYEYETHRLFINDLDPAIRDFWWSILNRPKEFLRLFDECAVNLDTWREWQRVYRDVRSSRLRRGFATFYLNRTNRSGIVRDGSVIGGIQQNSRWNMDARFNKASLRDRLEKLVTFRDRIAVSGLDGVEFIRTVADERVLLFLDPPYFAKGPSLYLNGLEREDHERLSLELQSLDRVPWILTYDDCPEIRSMYQWAAVRPFSMRYVAADRRHGSEIFITPRWLTVPSSQGSKAIHW